MAELKKDKLCWAHHPRGGIVTGLASGGYRENGVDKRDIGAMSFPNRQVHLVHPRGLCPICGDSVLITRTITSNGRWVGSCGDAFTPDQWIFTKV